MEEWRDIAGYEGIYQVSSMGNVRSLDRMGGNNHFYKGCVLKKRLKKAGYLQVQLCKNSEHKFFAIHRLVAIAFIPNPNNKPTVNHLDEDKTNNNVYNLEWATHRENTNYGTRTERMKKSKDYKAIGRKTSSTLINRGYGKKILQYDLFGNLIKEYRTINEAVKETGYCKSGIIGVCKHKKYAKTYKGYKWEYAI